MAELSVISNWITTSPAMGTFTLRMSMTPAPLVPPVLLVPLMSLPAGYVTSVSVPAPFTGSAFRAPRSSNILKSVSG